MSNDRACPSTEQLELLAVGRLPDPPASQLEEHLLECESCAEQTAEMQKGDTFVAAIKQAGRTPIQRSPEEQVRLDRLMDSLSGLRARKNDETWLSEPSTLGPQNTISEVDVVTQELKSVWRRAEADDEIGRMGVYRIQKVLGAGGMGAVFLAEDSQLHRKVALKMMRPRAAAAPGAADRFLREARAAAALRHDHILTIYQVGEEAGVPYLAMEYLEGESLEDRLKRESPLPVADALRISREIAEGLSAAHAKGMIHRDIKPANVWLEQIANSPYPRVKLLDFGLARSTEDESHLTSTGMIVGTPSYMSPEQASGEVLDGRADLFSLGVVLYRMTTGQLPFPGKNSIEVLRSLATFTPAAPRSINPDVPRNFSDLIERLLAKDQVNRPATAPDVAQKLAEIEDRISQAGLKPGTGDASGANRGRWMVTGLGAFFVLFLSAIWVTVKNDKGEVVATVKVPEGGSTTVGPLVTPESGATIQTPAPKNDSKQQLGDSTGSDTPVITLDALDPKAIPETERFDWQPDELVAVIGSHRLRNWWGIVNVVFHPSGEFFVSASQYGQAHVWSTKTLERLTGDGDPGFPADYTGISICFSPDGKSFYAGRGKYVVDLTDPKIPKFLLQGRRAVHKITEYEQPVISPNGRWLVIAGRPAGTLEIWDVATDVPRFVKEINYPVEYGNYLISSTNGRRIAISDYNPSSNMTHDNIMWDVDWDTLGGPTFTRFGESITGQIVAFDPDGNTLIKRGYIAPKSDQVLDLRVTPPRVAFEFEESSVAKISPDENWLAVNMGEIVLRRKTDFGWEERARIPSTDGPNCDFWFSPDGKTLVVRENSFGVMRVWDLTTMPPVERFPARHYRAVQFSPDGKLLSAAGGEANAVWKLDGSSPRLMAELGQGRSMLIPPSFSPDSKLVAFAVGVETRQALVWNLDETTPQLISDSDTRFIKFGPYGKTVQKCDGRQFLSYPWEVTKRGRFRLGTEPTLIAKLSDEIPMPHHFHQELLLDCLRSDIDRYLVPQDDGKLLVMSLKDPTKPIAELQHPDRKMIYSCVLSDTGDFVAASTYAGKSLVWDLTESPPRECLLTNQADGPSDPFFTADGKLLVVGSQAGVEIFDWAECRLVRTIKYPGPAFGMARHPDGKHIATVNGNGTIYILRLPELAAHANSAKGESKPKSTTSTTSANSQVAKLKTDNESKSITLALDPATIPESERYDWQPDELVSVIASHRLRNWGYINNVVFHPSGEFFVSGSNYWNDTQVWSTKSLTRITGSGDPDFPGGIDVNGEGVAFSPNGKSFFACRYGTYGVDLSNPEHPKFPLVSKRPIRNISDFQRYFSSPDSRWLVISGRPEGILEIWDVGSEPPRYVRELKFPKQHHLWEMVKSANGLRFGLNIHSDGIQTHFLLLDIDWNAVDGPTLTQLGEEMSGLLLVLSPDGKKLVKRDADKSRILDLSISPPRVEFEFDGTNLAAFSPDGNWIAVSAGEVVLWKKTAAGWEERSRIPNIDGMNCRFWFSPDAKTLVVAEQGAGVMRVWDLTADPPIDRLPTRHYRGVAFSPDGRLLAAAGGDSNSVWKLEGATPSLMAELGPGWGAISQPSFSDDSKLVKMGYDKAFVWDLSLSLPKLISDSDTSFIQFAPGTNTVQAWNGSRLVSYPWEITKRGRFRFGTETTEITPPLSTCDVWPWHFQRLSLRSLRPTARRFANVKEDRTTLQVWSLNDHAKPIVETQLPDHAPIQEFALSDDGNVLAGFSSDQKGFVWDLNETPPREYALQNPIYHAVDPFFSFDGKLLIVAHGLGIDIYDWAGGRLVRTIKYPGAAMSMARHPDGQHVATVNGNGTIYILRVPELAAHAKK